MASLAPLDGFADSPMRGATRSIVAEARGIVRFTHVLRAWRTHPAASVVTLCFTAGVAVGVCGFVGGVAWVGALCAAFAFVTAGALAWRRAPRAQPAWRDRVDAELLRLHAESARLGIGASPARGSDDAAASLRFVDDVARARDACYRLLRLGSRALRPDGAALYLLESDGVHLELQEQVVDDDAMPRTRITTTHGAVARALQQKHPVRLVDESGAATAHHRAGVKSVLAVPWMEGRTARGVLLFDRTVATPFTAGDEAFALALAAEGVSLLRTERAIVDVDAERRKNERIFDAARAFGGVVREDDAIETALGAALDVAPGIAAAVVDVVKDGARVALRVRGARGFLADAFAGELESGKTFAVDDDAWVGRAILQGDTLPHVPLHHVPKSAATRGLVSRDDGVSARCGDLRVIPLLARGEPCGALVVAVPVGESLRSGALEALAVVADMAGIALSAAQLFASVEKQATTDGLTGLFNRRTLDARLVESLARATRGKRALSVILVDIDHFKNVNDTYGHGAGDDVLRGVAQALAQAARTSDFVARYGGEEMCVLLEDTDAAGAAMVAERMRLAIKSLTFETEKGPLSVTASFGVGTLAQETAPGALLEKADACLYRAKREGRDRVVF